MGFLYYNIILKDKEIWSLYKLLLKKEFNTSSKNSEDLSLVRILLITKVILRDIY